MTTRAAPPALPQPEILSRNGSYVAYLRLEEHVGAFRDFLRQHGETPEEQELVAAKLMGRWRSGAPLVLCPGQRTTRRSAPTCNAHNDFNYQGWTRTAMRCPVGAHIRRMNPRDTAENMQRRKMIRRGGTYGPALARQARPRTAWNEASPRSSVVRASFGSSSSR